jgi:hypothetical protein
VPRDFIPLVDACVRVVLDQEVAYMEICTPLRIFTLRPTSSTLLARWVRVLSEFIGAEGCENNSRMELAERSISVHESRVSSKTMREKKLVSMGPSLGEVVAAGNGLIGDGIELQQSQPINQLLLPSSQQPPPLLPIDHHNASLTSPHHDLPIDTLTTSPDQLDTLDLMYDDLDLDLEDELYLPENGKSPEQTKYGEGLMGEANFVTSSVAPVEVEVDEEGREVHHDEDMNAEQRAALLRITGQLLSTSSQDRDYTPTTSPLCLIPPMHSDEMHTKEGQSPNSEINHFHVL